MKKYIVTGGAGFIGSHLVDSLLDLGHEVVIIDNFSSGRQENIQHQQNNSNLKVYNRNICDKNLSPLFNNVSAVFHVAAIPRVRKSLESPHETNETNITGTLNILETAKNAGVKRFIYSASSSAYGNQDSLPLIETMTPNPMSPYALQKLVGEHYCKLYHLHYGLETICLRYFNVFGPRQNPKEGYACLIPKSIDMVLNNQAPQIHGDGEQTRDFTFVKDIVKANIRAAFTENPHAFGHVFNVGNSNNVSVNNVIKTIIGNRDIAPNYLPPVIEPQHTLADTTKAQTMLGWKPEHTFEEAILETMGWFNTHQ